ncbi:hypothetical protein LOH54_07560 [Sulfurimonas sp. HSL-3221]|uniref:hypothetical protein n=1 Tax=Sulfurimonadaceae TaxID=2771471 RepID=UPI001E4965B2|nr:hypothetical protein [Sulfurimonas sp. HSL-3221]UFS61517.1 hypothetical protein LOH54_07560 [Sulfurimonas sp. HSL-3221]
MTTKIIFSDGKVQFIDSADTAFCSKLKDAQSDKGINDLLSQHIGSFDLYEEMDAGKVECTVDLLKKKQSSIKRMKRAFGGH